ncbi:hypothetical protein AB0K62_24600 [Streptomyces halstedii]|uniref:hypothetical protein n=1 Tax=Streptomyces halstedii TaxID=1944 RepID=UPI00346085B1
MERYLIPVAGGDPVLVTRPKTVRHVVAFLPAPTEPRCGRFGSFTQWAALWADHGVASLLADLPGGGDSTVVPRPDAWVRQAGAVHAQAELLAGRKPVHLLARGAAAALLPVVRNSGIRIVMSPPLPEECRRAAAMLRDDEVPDADVLSSVVGLQDIDQELDGDVRPLLNWAADQLVKVRWDLELHAAHRPPRATSAITFSDIDPLARLEITRVGIGHVLAGLFDELVDMTNWEG